ncbi:MAG: hypothetical protein RI897_1433 [Verrucomicrobiota bacterium]
MAVDIVFPQDAFDDHFLGELFVIVEGAIDAGAEVAVESEEGGFLFDVDFVGAAGEVEVQVGLLEAIHERGAAVDEEVIGLDGAGFESVDSVVDADVEAAEVFVFVPERFLGGAAALFDAIGELDHLVDRLLAVEAHDVVEHQAVERFIRIAFLPGKHFDEHGDHDIGPALADEREGAVEVEDHVTDSGAGLEGGLQFYGS